MLMLQGRGWSTLCLLLVTAATARLLLRQPALPPWCCHCIPALGTGILHQNLGTGHIFAVLSPKVGAGTSGSSCWTWQSDLLLAGGLLPRIFGALLCSHSGISGREIPVFAFRNFMNRHSSESEWGAAAGESEMVKEGLPMQVQMWPNIKCGHDAKQPNEAESGTAKSSDPTSASWLRISLKHPAGCC